MEQVKTKLVDLFDRLTSDQLRDNDLSIYVHTNKYKIFGVGIIQHDAEKYPHPMLSETYLRNEFDSDNDVLCIKELKSKTTGFDSFSELYGMFLRDYFDKYINLESDKSGGYCYDYKRCVVKLEDLK